MSNGERSLDDVEGAHVEHVATRLGARQTVIDKVEVRLGDFAGMRRRVGEVAVKSRLQRLWVAQWTDRSLEGVDRGVSPSRQHIQNLSSGRISFVFGSGKGNRRRQNRSVLTRARDEARSH